MTSTPRPRRETAARRARPSFGAAAFFFAKIVLALTIKIGAGFA